MRAEPCTSGNPFADALSLIAEEESGGKNIYKYVKFKLGTEIF
jgi:hypothetical protein